MVRHFDILAPIYDVLVAPPLIRSNGATGCGYPRRDQLWTVGAEREGSPIAWEHSWDPS